MGFLSKVFKTANPVSMVKPTSKGLGKKLSGIASTKQIARMGALASTFKSLVKK